MMRTMRSTNETEQIYFDASNPLLKLGGDLNSINFLFHINTFDYPVEHSHVDFYEFTMMVDGEVANFINSQKIIAAKGDVLIGLPSDCHAIKKLGNGKLRYINFLVRAKHFEEICGKTKSDLLSWLPSFSRVIHGKEELLLHFESAARNADFVSEEKRAKTQTSFESLLFHILSELLEIQANPEGQKPTSKFERSLQEIQREHPLYGLKVQDLCDKMNYSRASLNRLFKKHYGLLPSEFLLREKMDHARNLLLTTDMSIFDVAIENGYSGSCQFTVVFHDYFGMTPTQFRRQLQGQKN